MYAVKLYETVSNKPEGIPDGWPAEVVDIGEAQELPEWCDETWDLMSQEELDTQKSNNQSAYNTWYASYTSIPIEEVIKRKILAAMEFGRNLMAEYGSQNVLAGFTLEQIQDIMARTSKVQAALSTGSLYVALVELDAVETDEVVVTTARITECRNKIQAYLGIPLT